MKLAHLTLVACLMAAPVALTTTDALAGGASDEEVRPLLDAIYESEYRAGKFKDGLEKLEIAKILCEGTLCSHGVRAQLFVAIGTMHVRLGNTRGAAVAFATAVKEDAGAELRKGSETPEVSAAFATAKPAGSATLSPDDCRASYAGAPAPRGWQNGGAAHCFNLATLADRAGKHRTCATHARKALELEDNPNGRATLAKCLEADNNWIEAADEWEEAARQAPKTSQNGLAQQARYRADQLRRRIPVLVLVPPTNQPEGFAVELDGSPFPVEALGSEMPMNPGEHTILATGKRGDLALRFKQSVRLESGANFPVALELAPYSPEIKCLLEAQNAEGIAKCLSRADSVSNITTRVRSEASGYHDTMHVDVFSPSVSVSAEHVTGGWGIGASMLVDMVTAASVDIVATASPRWREVRWVPALNAHKRFSDLDVGISGGFSREPDYLATDIAARASLDLADKTITPTIVYDFSHDINAKADTPWDVFSKRINRHSVTMDLGVILTKSTFGSLSSTMVFENGDTSKPYRHIPMFDPKVAPLIRPGEMTDTVNLYRLAERPLEQLPTSRKRFAIAAQLAQRFSSSTLRVSQRLYTDTWTLKATTTDVRYMVDVTKDLRVWPHVRFHAQTGTNFYKLAYEAGVNADGTTNLPVYRTGDRELGPLLSGTGGAGARYDFGGRHSYALSLNGDVIYTSFPKTLFTSDRWGYFGALTFEATFE